MKACGQRFPGLEKLASLLNLLKPMTSNNYDKIEVKLTNAVKDVASITMFDTRELICGDVSDNTIVDTAVYFAGI